MCVWRLRRVDFFKLLPLYARVKWNRACPLPSLPISSLLSTAPTNAVFSGSALFPLPFILLHKHSLAPTKSVSVSARRAVEVSVGEIQLCMLKVPAMCQGCRLWDRCLGRRRTNHSPYPLNLSQVESPTCVKYRNTYRTLCAATEDCKRNRWRKANSTVGDKG